MKKVLLAMAVGVFYFNPCQTMRPITYDKIQTQLRYDEDFTTAFVNLLHSPKLAGEQKLQKQLKRLSANPTVDINQKDENGNSPIFLIYGFINDKSTSGSLKSLAEELFLDIAKERDDFDANTQDSRGNTILHILFRDNRDALIQNIWWRPSTDLLIKNNEGKYAWEMSATKDLMVYSVADPTYSMYSYYMRIKAGLGPYQCDDDTREKSKKSMEWLWAAYRKKCYPICNQILSIFGMTEEGRNIFGFGQAPIFAEELIKFIDGFMRISGMASVSDLGSIFVQGGGDPKIFEMVVMPTFDKLYKGLAMSERFLPIKQDKNLLLPFLRGEAPERFPIFKFPKRNMMNKAIEIKSVPWVFWCKEHNIISSSSVVDLCIKRGDLNMLQTVLEQNRYTIEFLLFPHFSDIFPNVQDAKSMIQESNVWHDLLRTIVCCDPYFDNLFDYRIWLNLWTHILHSEFLSIEDLEEAQRIAENSRTKYENSQDTIAHIEGLIADIADETRRRPQVSEFFDKIEQAETENLQTFNDFLEDNELNNALKLAEKLCLEYDDDVEKKSKYEELIQNIKNELKRRFSISYFFIDIEQAKLNSGEWYHLSKRDLEKGLDIVTKYLRFSTGEQHNAYENISKAIKHEIERREQATE